MSHESGPQTAIAAHCLPPALWWRLSRVDAVGAVLGLILGFLAAGPLMWLAAEARRVQNFELTPAGRFTSGQLLFMWAGGALVGCLLAATLARNLTGGRTARPASAPVGIFRLLLGSLAVAALAPILPALLLGLRAHSPLLAREAYQIVGIFVGWQSGLITFVFLYTLRWLEQIRHAREVAS